jgi:hypothetical protein
VCPRTPRLTLVLEAGWLPVGHMMWWGFRQMGCGSSVLLGRLRVGSAAGWRELAAVHLVIVGLPRDRCGGQGATGSSAVSPRPRRRW